MYIYVFMLLKQVLFYLYRIIGLMYNESQREIVMVGNFGVNKICYWSLEYLKCYVNYLKLK